MTIAANLTGEKFGRLLAVRRVGSNSSGQALWECACDCGATKVTIVAFLRSGHTTSCGCAARDSARAVMSARHESGASTKHGHTRRGWRSGEHGVWTAMIQRCTNSNTAGYSEYGARGIMICVRWRSSFEAFLADMGTRPPGMSIDRKDNNGGYWCGSCEECREAGRPSNCRWATSKEQARNKRQTINITFGGRTQCLRDWATEYGLVEKRLRVAGRADGFEKALAAEIALALAGAEGAGA